MFLAILAAIKGLANKWGWFLVDVAGFMRVSGSVVLPAVVPMVFGIMRALMVPGAKMILVVVSFMSSLVAGRLVMMGDGFAGAFAV